MIDELSSLQKSFSPGNVGRVRYAFASWVSCASACSRPAWLLALAAHGLRSEQELGVAHRGTHRREVLDARRRIERDLVGGHVDLAHRALRDHVRGEEGHRDDSEGSQKEAQVETRKTFSHGHLGSLKRDGSGALADPAAMDSGSRAQ